MQDEATRADQVSGMSVLVVEDEFLIALDIAMMLEHHGHTVFGSAGSIADALNLLETGRPDVALLDMNLRGELVTPVAERLQSLSIPFIVASAYRSVDVEGCAVLAEVENIGKPISERRLMEALRRAVQAV